MKHQAATIVGQPRLDTGLQKARRWVGLVVIDLRVALVADDDEVVPLGQRHQVFEPGKRYDRAAGIARVADVQQLAALPDGSRHRLEIR